MSARDDAAEFVVPCPCGRRLPFTESARGSVIDCACGLRWRIAPRRGGAGRAWGRVVWAWRWLVAGDRRAEAPRDRVAYREGHPRVACPRCASVPPRGAHWMCEFCWCSWDTFATRGRCPGCGFAFTATSCPSCHAFARHEDWYRPAPRSEGLG